MKDRTKFILIALAGTLVAGSMSTVMLIAGITHRSAFDVVMGTYGSRAAHPVDQAATPYVLDDTIAGVYGVPVTLSPVGTGGTPRSAAYDDGLSMKLLAISPDGAGRASASFEVQYPVPGEAGSTLRVQIRLTERASPAVDVAGYHVALDAISKDKVTLTVTSAVGSGG